jgi:hypothetical protein
MAEFCQTHQVTRLRQAGYSWARIAFWAGVSAQALHNKHAENGRAAGDHTVADELDPRDSPTSQRAST